MSPAEGQLTGRDPPPSLTLKIQGYFDSPDQNPQFKVEVLPSTTARQLAVKIEQKTGMGRHLQMLKTESGDCIWNGWFQVECSGVNLSMDQVSDACCPLKS